MPQMASIHHIPTGLHRGSSICSIRWAAAPRRVASWQGSSNMAERNSLGLSEKSTVNPQETLGFYPQQKDHIWGFL